MRRLSNKMREMWKLLSRTIYVGERLESNISVIRSMSIIVGFIGLAMTVMNIVQKKGFVTYTTTAIFILGCAGYIAATFYRNRMVTIAGITCLSVVIFSYYSIKGVNEGFAILWTLLVPLALCFIGGVKIGILLSVYYEILFIILFYTPIRNSLGEYYTVTFMNRYPMLYLCCVMMVSVSMYQYHVSILKQMDYEVELKEAIERAVAADSAKSRFLAQMSHEIRTPINAVLGMNEMILRESSDPDILEYSGNINSAGNTLLTLINSILDFSKIEDGKMELVPVRFDTASVINELIVAITPRAQAKGLDLNTDIDGKLPSALYGDDVRISQVINNLLTNAVKYTEKGKVTLTVRNDGIDDGIAKVFVSVADTGIGIKEEDKDKLFVSFERLDVVKNRHIEGTGLGMSIVTKLLDLMDSKLNVESVYGEGSEFSFTLLLKVEDSEPVGNYAERIASRAAVKASSKLIEAPNARVLVVDDNDMNLKVAKGLLKLCKVKADLAVSGYEAIDRMRTKEYDIVFLDHLMPKMDGIETLAELKKEGLLPDHTKTVALTANAIVGAKESYLAAGFDDYLAKPIEIEDLEKKLLAYLPEEAYTAADAKVQDAVKEEAGKNASDSAADGEVLEFAAVDNEALEFTPDEGGEEGGIRFDMKKLAAAGVDTAAGLGFCAGDESFYFELLSDYIKAVDDKGNALDEKYGAKDWKDYQILVHALKSTSKTVGLTEISEKALALENAAKAGDAAFIESNHADFMNGYRSMVNKLRS